MSDTTKIKRMNSHLITVFIMNKLESLNIAYQLDKDHVIAQISPRTALLANITTDAPYNSICTPKLS